MQCRVFFFSGYFWSNRFTYLKRLLKEPQLCLKIYLILFASQWKWILKSFLKFCYINQSHISFFLEGLHSNFPPTHLIICSLLSEDQFYLWVTIRKQILFFCPKEENTCYCFIVIFLYIKSLGRQIRTQWTPTALLPALPRDVREVLSSEDHD